MDIKFSMSQADVTRRKRPRIELDAQCPGFTGGEEGRMRSRELDDAPVNPIKTHYENVNDETFTAESTTATAFSSHYRGNSAPYREEQPPRSTE